MHRKAIFIVVVLLAVAVLARAVHAEVVVTKLPDQGQVELTLPAGWKAASSVEETGSTIELSVAKGTDATVAITVFPAAPDSPVRDAESLRAIVMQRGTELLPTALQERIDLIEVKPADGAGFLYHLTDRHPEEGPGDFREMRQGAMLVGGRLATVTILSHTADATFVGEALAVLATVKVKIPKSGGS